jgi:hypothetical protein
MHFFSSKVINPDNLTANNENSKKLMHILFT